MTGPRSLCCHVATATHAFATYYLVSVILVGADILLALARGADPIFVRCTKSLPNGLQLVDTASTLLLLLLLALCCGLVLFARHKGAASLVPFVMLLFMDVGLSILSLSDAPWGLPGTPTYSEAMHLAEYFREEATLKEPQAAHCSMVFGVLFVFYILLKVHMLQVAMSCYYMMREEESSLNNHKGKEETIKVKLPSYDEALKQMQNATPPTYKEV